ncbi:glycosyl hydrolase [Streptomyces viridodiastaticus]|uniref:glycosyl hydrolase n=1 Tax=Streptomyces albogriseolus TaxID=1887 RepID=UPI0022503B09|nr:glycosyl hydrolase [Streptomyces viridodiastaticus]MCX4566534.1 glycosyl hydrolase [Streptomyces viridodiastaticus]
MRFRRPLALLSAAAMAAGGLVATIGSGVASAATVEVGKGSYSDVRPAGRQGPSNNGGQAVKPKVTPRMADTPVPTNDWWSSLAFQRFAANPWSENMYGHPLTYKAVAGGLEVGYPTDHEIVGGGRQYEFAHEADLTLGLAGLNSPDAKADGWSDWTVTPSWNDGARTLRTTIGHGMPYVYAEGTGGAAQIKAAAPPTVFADQGNVLGVTISGHHYALFAPSSSDWTVSGNEIKADLGSKDYFSLAVLPGTDALADYEKYAFSFVTGSKVDWEYREGAGEVEATYSLITEAKEGTEKGTLQALYRHQWLHTSDPLTDYSYVSPRGEMKVREGTSFTTVQKVNGVLPGLPSAAGVDRAKLKTYINDVLTQGDPFSGAIDTYWTGKALGKLAQLVPIADQIGDTASRDKLIELIEGRMEEWFTVGGPSEFSYDKDWRTLIGYPASYGSDQELNDHHFHYSYYVMAAAIVAQYDPQWAADSEWGGMVKELIKDAANPARDDSKYPFLRGFDVYAGHSWAAGHEAFAAGNNQESSSESINLSAGLIMWGSATGDKALRDQGVYMMMTESESIAQYWFDADQHVYPEDFTHDVVGMVWSSGGAYATWWTANPEEIHGINFLPMTGGSLHLAREKDMLRRSVTEMEEENGGPAVEWKDIFWQVQALYDPAKAMQYWNQWNGGYVPEAGETKAHTYHWVSTMNSIGAPDMTVTANSPTATVFDKNGAKTYAAHNYGAEECSVLFSDGGVLNVPAKSTASGPGDDTELGTLCGAPGDDRPSAPGTPVAGDITDDSVELTWEAATDDLGIKDYDVYRGDDKVATVDGTTYTDTGLASGTEYTYSVRARDTSSQVGPPSGTVTVTTTGTRDQPPGAPGTPVAGEVTSTSVELTWEAATDDKGVKDYDVYRGGTKVATVTGTTHTDTGLTAGTEYSYSVKARDTAGQTGPASGTLKVTTAGNPPVTADTFYPQSGGALATEAAATGSSDTIPSAGGTNNDGTPKNPLVYEVENVNGTLKSGSSTAFTFKVDAGGSVGYAQQARVSYDLTGDGTFERVETFRYFATDPVPGWEDYSSARQGLHSASGTLGDLDGGTVRVEVWSALGNGPSTLQVGAGSVLTIPFA